MATRTRAQSRAQGNASGILKVLVDRDGYADLYRTITAGPSGQRGDLLVGRVRYTYRDPFEIQIIDMTSRYDAGSTAGYAVRRPEQGHGVWAIYSYDEWDGTRFLGYADSLSLGVDVVVNGEHAAMRNHDSGRVSRGRWEPNPYRYV